MTIYQVFEQEVRQACDDYQASRIDHMQFIERIINARNKMDLALIEEQG